MRKIKKDGGKERSQHHKLTGLGEETARTPADLSDNSDTLGRERYHAVGSWRNFMEELSHHLSLFPSFSSLSLSLSHFSLYGWDRRGKDRNAKFKRVLDMSVYFSYCFDI